MARTTSLFGTCSAELGGGRSCLYRRAEDEHRASPRGWQLVMALAVDDGVICTLMVLYGV